MFHYNKNLILLLVKFVLCIRQQKDWNPGEGWEFKHMKFDDKKLGKVLLWGYNKISWGSLVPGL